MKQNKHWPALAAAITCLAIAACVGYAPGATQAGEPGVRQAGDVTVSPTSIALAWIPAGTFTMGNPGNSPPQRQVTISEGFWIGVYPVTQQQWEQIMGNNPSYFQANPAGGETQGRRPVEQVSWYDALVFANRLSILEGLAPAYRIGGSTNPDDWGDAPYWVFSEIWDAVEIVPGSNGWRLPTEAQWEYAARAGTTTAFSNGVADWYEDIASLQATGWFHFNSDDMTREVGLRQANPWGLHDIHGNVWEWVWDWFGANPNEAQTDPAGAASGRFRVNRGGSFTHSPNHAGSAFRSGDAPFGRYNFLGLRLARP